MSKIYHRRVIMPGGGLGQSRRCRLPSSPPTLETTHPLNPHERPPKESASFQVPGIAQAGHQRFHRKNLLSPHHIQCIDRLGSYWSSSVSTFISQSCELELISARLVSTNC